MRIAIAATRPPYPLDSGGRIRTFHLLREMSAVHHLTFVTAVENASDRERLRQLERELPRLSVRATPLPSTREVTLRGTRRLLNAIDPTPYTWVPYRNRRFAETIVKTLSDGEFDVVHCDHVQLAYAFEHVRSLPRVLNAHNVEYKILQGAATEDRRLHRRILLTWQATKVREAERRALSFFDGVVAVSEVDRAEIERMADGVPVSVVPNGVDIERFAPLECQADPGLMTFIGAMDWLPNADAAAYAAEEIMPRIQRALPHARLRLVGRNPNRGLIRRLASSAVELTGTVADVRPELARAALVIVPLRIGSGTRLKILEAWAMGKAVLSTSLGAEGLPARDGDNIVLADSPESFACQAIELLRHPQRTAALGMAGRRTAREHFSWERIAVYLTEAYQNAVERHRRGRSIADHRADRR